MIKVASTASVYNGIEKNPNPARRIRMNCFVLFYIYPYILVLLDSGLSFLGFVV